MNLIQILLIATVVVIVIVRRFAGAPVRARSLVLPLAIAGYGAYLLHGVHLGAGEVAFLALEAVLGFGVGALRGTTIALYVREGVLWQRYRWSTLAVWVAAIALRVGMTVGGQLIGLHVPQASLMLVLGLSFVGEGLVVGQRAIRHDAPIAPSRRAVRV